MTAELSAPSQQISLQWNLRQLQILPPNRNSLQKLMQIVSVLGEELYVGFSGGKYSGRVNDFYVPTSGEVLQGCKIERKMAPHSFCKWTPRHAGDDCWFVWGDRMSQPGVFLLINCTSRTLGSSLYTSLPLSIFPVHPFHAFRLHTPHQPRQSFHQVAIRLKTVLFATNLYQRKMNSLWWLKFQETKRTQ